MEAKASIFYVTLTGGGGEILYFYPQTFSQDDRLKCVGVCQAVRSMQSVFQYSDSDNLPQQQQKQCDVIQSQKHLLLQCETQGGLRLLLNVNLPFTVVQQQQQTNGNGSGGRWKEFSMNEQRAFMGMLESVGELLLMTFSQQQLQSALLGIDQSDIGESTTAENGVKVAVGQWLDCVVENWLDRWVADIRLVQDLGMVSIGDYGHMGTNQGSGGRQFDQILSSKAYSQDQGDSLVRLAMHAYHLVKDQCQAVRYGMVLVAQSQSSVGGAGASQHQKLQPYDDVQYSMVYTDLPAGAARWLYTAHTKFSSMYSVSDRMGETTAREDADGSQLIHLDLTCNGVSKIDIDVQRTSFWMQNVPIGQRLKVVLLLDTASGNQQNEQIDNVVSAVSTQNNTQQQKIVDEYFGRILPKISTDLWPAVKAETLKQGDIVAIVDHHMHYRQVFVGSSSATVGGGTSSPIFSDKRQLEQSIKERYVKNDKNQWTVTVNRQLLGQTLHAQLAKAKSLQQVCEDLKPILNNV